VTEIPENGKSENTRIFTGDLDGGPLGGPGLADFVQASGPAFMIKHQKQLSVCLPSKCAVYRCLVDNCSEYANLPYSHLMRENVLRGGGLENLHLADLGRNVAMYDGLGNCLRVAILRQHPMSRFRNKIAHVGMLIDTRAVSNSEALTILPR
jgi:hypothetical protein